MIEYNANQKYNLATNSCQHFAKKALKALKREELACNFEGSIDQYFSRIDQSGLKSQIFMHPFKKQEIKFTTHRQLDNFMRNFINEDFKQHIIETKPELEYAPYPELLEAFKEERPQDYALLKAFDRSWWLKVIKNCHIRQVSEESMKPKYMGDNCPFGDPTVTGSIPLSALKQNIYNENQS